MSIVDDWVLRVCSGAKVRLGLLADGADQAACGQGTGDGPDGGGGPEAVAVGGLIHRPGGRVWVFATRRR